MTPAEAARLLQLSPESSPDQIDARFVELRHTLEQKISRAPTPGLQEKYRTALTEVTIATYVLKTSGEAGPLPVVKRPVASPPAPEPPVLATASAPAPTIPAPVRPRRTWQAARIGLLTTLLMATGIGWWLWDTNAVAEKLAAYLKEKDYTWLEQPVKESWEVGTLEQHVNDVREMWVRLEQHVAKYEADADETMELYRSGMPDESLERRVATWARSCAYATWARQRRQDMAPGGSLHRKKSALEAILATGNSAKMDAHRKECDEFFELLADLSDDGPSGYFWSHVSITSDPPGLKWTIESHYDGGKTLVVSGTTPVREQAMFIGYGDGTLRIKHPGKPDFVARLKDLGTPSEEVAEHAVFK